MSYLSVTEMTQGDRSGAEVLVRAFAPAVPESRWKELIERPRPAGALVLRTPDGSIFGLASYRPKSDGQGSDVLLVDNFVTAELSRRGRGRALLADALAERARALGCTGIWQAPDGQGPLRNALAIAEGR
jgi:GNAT superfamily N-acetyltransferase